MLCICAGLARAWSTRPAGSTPASASRAATKRSMARTRDTLDASSISRSAQERRCMLMVGGTPPVRPVEDEKAADTAARCRAMGSRPRMLTATPMGSATGSSIRWLGRSSTSATRMRLGRSMIVSPVRRIRLKSVRGDGTPATSTVSPARARVLTASCRLRMPVTATSSPLKVLSLNAPLSAFSTPSSPTTMRLRGCRFVLSGSGIGLRNSSVSEFPADCGKYLSTFGTVGGLVIWSCPRRVTVALTSARWRRTSCYEPDCCA